jgi:hypothetical protein
MVSIGALMVDFDDIRDKLVGLDALPGRVGEEPCPGCREPA